MSPECLFYDLLNKSSTLRACKINAHEYNYICNESSMRMDPRKCPLCREKICDISANEVYFICYLKLFYLYIFMFIK